jgi:GT2 family glycosyltransferase
MKTRICIGIPTNGQIRTRTVFALTRMLKKLQVPYDVLTHESCYIHVNRERLVQRAIEGGYSHILFLDSDMFFEPDALEKLLEKDKDIIGIGYNYRGLPPRSTVMIETRDGEIIDEKHGDLRKVAGMATGFLLINLKVFEKLSHPWFFYEMDGHEVLQGDDFWFCEKARKAGFDIWSDDSQKIYHLGEYLY